MRAVAVLVVVFLLPYCRASTYSFSQAGLFGRLYYRVLLSTVSVVLEGRNFAEKYCPRGLQHYNA